MRKVSKSKLRRMESRGATVKTQTKVVKDKPEKPVVVPAPAPDNTKLDSLSKTIETAAQKVKSTQRDVNLSAAISALQEDIKNIRISMPDPITEWEFTPIRDDDGILLRIEAKAVTH